MGRPLGHRLSQETKDRIGEGSRRSWALRNAINEAGEAVLYTAATEPGKVRAVATRELDRIEQEFGDIFRLEEAS